MTYTDKAIQTFGFEDVRTITIAILEEQGKTDFYNLTIQNYSR